ncbi:hypothetical protein DP117_35355 [Brasilonema sp. UFV-L1]|nr:hypothetical protein [Brasilonema sp. UFV-L1]
MSFRIYSGNFFLETTLEKRGGHFYGKILLSLQQNFIESVTNIAQTLIFGLQKFHLVCKPTSD